MKSKWENNKYNHAFQLQEVLIFVFNKSKKKQDVYLFS